MILDGKVAAVTGAGSGIGRAVAQRLAKEGAKVVLLDNNEARCVETAELIKAEGGAALPVTCDITSREQVFAGVKAGHEAYGNYDILINCAGYSKILPFLDCTDEIWDRTMDINVKGQFLCCQAVIPLMNQNGASIVNFSSESGKKGTLWYQAYCASKFAIIGFTQALASEFAAAGIRVNAICPGVVPTPMWDTQVADYAKKRNLQPEEVMPRFIKGIPMHRLCDLEDVTNLVMFLVTPASSYITGQSLNLCGGNTMY